jgi:hypothetical protein
MGVSNRREPLGRTTPADCIQGWDIPPNPVHRRQTHLFSTVLRYRVAEWTRLASPFHFPAAKKLAPRTSYVTYSEHDS